MKENIEELEPVQELQMEVWPDGREDFPQKKELFAQQQELAAWTRSASETINTMYIALEKLVQRNNSTQIAISESKEQEVPIKEVQTKEESPEPVYKPLGDGSKLWTEDTYTIRREQVPEHILKIHAEGKQHDIEMHP